jgi:hypothetical protein
MLPWEVRLRRFLGGGQESPRHMLREVDSEAVEAIGGAG